MKLTKLTILATAATLVLGISSAKAAIGVTTNYSILTISGTVTTNLPTVVSGNLYKYPVKTAKYGNKQLLDVFAGWTNADRSIDPWKTAKLVIGWDHSSDVLVVDKTGTNILFDATVGVGGGLAYFSIDFWEDYGVGNYRWLDADPGYYGGVDTGDAYYTFYDDDYYLPYTDMWGYGGNKQTFMQKWDASGNGTTWTDSESANFLSSGDQYFFDFGSDTTSTAKITTSGKGKGYNYIGWF